MMWFMIGSCVALFSFNTGRRRSYYSIFMITSSKWKHFTRYWPFVWGIHRSPLNSQHNGQWRGALMFSLICSWINCWVNQGEAGDLRRNLSPYDVNVMYCAGTRPIKLPSEREYGHLGRYDMIYQGPFLSRGKEWLDQNRVKKWKNDFIFYPSKRVGSYYLSIPEFQRWLKLGDGLMSHDLLRITHSWNKTGQNTVKNIYCYIKP